MKFAFSILMDNPFYVLVCKLLSSNNGQNPLESLLTKHQTKNVNMSLTCFVFGDAILAMF